MEKISWNDFEKVEMCIGTIIEVNDFPEARKPAYQLTIDFGKEIGIRKSLGATPGRILQQFLIEAIVICLLGGIGGIMLAIPIGNLIAQGISSGAASFIIPWLWMMTGIIICVLVGLFSGIYPAFKASKMDPVEALRYE